MSSKNPLHSAQRPARAPSPPLPPLPPPSPPPTTASAQPSSSHAAPFAVEDIDDDLPPPYTPAANVGEETISLGPRRPFQQPPPQPSSSSYPHPSQRPWPAQPHPPPQNAGYYAQPSPAPWQTQHQYRQRQKGGGGLIGALIDTVRDIADVVSGAHDDRMMTAQSANAAAYASPYNSTHTPYAPPPGSMQGAYSAPPGPPPPPRPASAPPQSPPAVPDDGSPTRTPVPGHPLLLDGNLLVYPRDHLCVKCKNTGYKNYDPSNPCRKCWDKYGKPYAGALTYTPWSSSGNDPRMQRALPRFVPPHLTRPPPPSGPPGPPGAYPPPPRHPHHNRSISHHTHERSPGPSFYVTNPLSPSEPPPVVSAVAVSPGDPRLGGRLCLRCHGEGLRTVMLFDMTMCETCGGTGRVWR